MARNRHIIHVELSRPLQLYSCLEFEANCLLGAVFIHRRGIEVDSALAGQDMAKCERTPFQSCASFPDGLRWRSMVGRKPSPRTWG